LLGRSIHQNAGRVRVRRGFGGGDFR